LLTVLPNCADIRKHSFYCSTHGVVFVGSHMTCQTSRAALLNFSSISQMPFQMPTMIPGQTWVSAGIEHVNQVRPWESVTVTTKPEYITYHYNIMHQKSYTNSH